MTQASKRTHSISKAAKQSVMCLLACLVMMSFCQAQEKADLEKEGLKGAVKSVKECTYDANENRIERVRYLYPLVCKIAERTIEYYE
ncbi:MAG: hypothetical protein LBO06_08015 [Bacteroidales bacterium]|jgi:hypothetical protein|nr:hypothetical protein [Bacteroidales bacterium]